jgi:hypothetical protein
LKSAVSGWPSESKPTGTMAQLAGCEAQKEVCLRLLVCGYSSVRAARKVLVPCHDG